MVRSTSTKSASIVITWHHNVEGECGGETYFKAFVRYLLIIFPITNMHALGRDQANIYFVIAKLLNKGYTFARVGLS